MSDKIVLIESMYYYVACNKIVDAGIAIKSQIRITSSLSEKL